jgi:hypothetical protein
MTLHLYFFYQWGESIRGLSSSPFLAIYAEGGESIKPKAKGPHHHFNFFKNKEEITSLVFVGGLRPSKVLKNVI